MIHPPVVEVGADHRGTPLAQLESLHGGLAGGASLATLRGSCRGVVPVITCHRLELYLEGVTPAKAVELWCQWLGGAPESTAGAPLVRRGEAVACHLLRVASGLESAVLGEDQVLGQLRAAYRAACAADATGPLLHRLFHAAFRCGRRVRSETDLTCGSRSLPAAAVNLLSAELAGLAGRRVLVLGAGEIGSIAARRLAERGVGELLVANRTWHRAADLAAATGGRAIPWAWRGPVLSRCDAVIASAAVAPVVNEIDLLAATTDRELVAVDLAVPRSLPTPLRLRGGLRVIDVAELTALLAAGDAARISSLEAAEAIVAREVRGWLEWASLRSSPTQPGPQGAVVG